MFGGSAFTGTELVISVSWSGSAETVDTAEPALWVAWGRGLKISPQAQSLLPELPSWARDVPSVTPSPCRNSGENGGPTYATVKSDGAVTTECCTQLLSGATVLSRDQDEALQCDSWGRKDWVFLPGLLPSCSRHDVGQAFSNGFNSVS